MKSLSLKHENKTNKSIYNILIGKKSHQTYFDAAIENLKMYYGILPNLKFSDFEKQIKQSLPSENKAIIADFFFEQVEETVNTIILLVQMISHKNKQIYSYQPIQNDKRIQDMAKLIFKDIKNQQEEVFINEVDMLFASLSSHFDQIYSHYLFTGYNESAYTLEQIVLIENVSIMKLKCQLIEEFQLIRKYITNKEIYPILSNIIFMPKLHIQTESTLTLLKQNRSLSDIAQIKNVKEHTIHDHIIEMYIKGYLPDIHLFISKDSYQKFNNLFQAYPNQKLKFYYEQLNIFSYFEIKLMYVAYKKEALNAIK